MNRLLYLLSSLQVATPNKSARLRQKLAINEIPTLLSAAALDTA